jgi:predicted transcriptional regulator
MGIAGARGRVGGLVFGAMAAEAVFTAARLRVADVLGDGQHSTAELAREVGADEESLARLLRALAALELLSEPAPAQFRLTEAGQLLRSDQPESMHAIVRMFGDATMRSAWRELETSIRTGKLSFEKIYGTSFVDYLSTNPELCEQFNAAMRQGTLLAAQQLLQHYDFGSLRAIADIGGGDGALLAEVLQAHPGLRGILFDTADGLAHADRTLSDAGIRERCAIRAGDFFAAAPEDAEVYLLKSVLRGWDDDRAGRILAHIRRVSPDAGRLLIIEPMLPDVFEASRASTMYLSDLNMMVAVGGRLRTRADFEQLCERAGFTVQAVMPLPPPTPFCVLEATPHQRQLPPRSGHACRYPHGMGIAGARGHVGGLVFGAMAAEAVFTAARMRVADLVGDGQRSGSEVAKEIGADEEALTRLLRTLAALELVSEPAPGQFRLTEAGQLLRSDRPESLHAFVCTFGDPTMLSAWRELDTAIRTGKPTFEKVYSTTFFDHLSANPELSEQFNAAMRQGTTLSAQQLLQHYDFGKFRTIADIGGGDGTLLAEVLQAYPSLRGILFDTAAGLAEANRTLTGANVVDRCAIRVGNFLAAAPEGADVYLLKSVLQDWDDDRAGVILGHIRRVIPDGGHLLIIEPVLPDVVDASAPCSMFLTDLNMLVNLGGRVRTRAAFEQLCEQTGFTLHAVTPLPPPVAISVLEVAPH